VARTLGLAMGGGMLRQRGVGRAVDGGGVVARTAGTTGLPDPGRDLFREPAARSTHRGRLGHNDDRGVALAMGWRTRGELDNSPPLPYIPPTPIASDAPFWPAPALPPPILTLCPAHPTRFTPFNFPPPPTRNPLPTVTPPPIRPRPYYFPLTTHPPHPPPPPTPPVKGLRAKPVMITPTNRPRRQ